MLTSSHKSLPLSSPPSRIAAVFETNGRRDRLNSRSNFIRHGVQASAQGQQGDGAGTGNSSGVLDTIVNELREYHSGTKQKQDGGELLHDLIQLDALHYGSTVATSWEGSAAWLQIEGSVQDGEMARRMAMLSVNQERVFCRSQQLAQLVAMMAKLRPGVLPPEAVLRVQNQQAKAFASLEVLTIQHLIQLSVAVLPLSTLHQLLTDSAAAAYDQLKLLPSFQGQPSRLAQARTKLDGDVLFWKYKLQQAVLRLHHAGNIAKAGVAYQKLQDQRNAVQAATPASRSLFRPVPSTISQSAGSAPMSHSKAAEVFLLGQVEMMKRATSTWPGCGRAGFVSFGREQCVAHTSSKKNLRDTGSSSMPLIAEDGSQPEGGAWLASGLCSGAMQRSVGVQGHTSFGADQGHEFRVAHALLMRAHATPVSAAKLPEASCKLEAVLRANLINSIGNWADRHADAFPELAPLPQTCLHSTRLRSAGDNVRTGENVARRFTVMTSGKALPELRKQARQRGQWLLRDLYPQSDLASLVIPDWEYNTQATVAWNRFVSVPPKDADEAKLTLFLDAPLSPSNSSAASTPEQPPASSPATTQPVGSLAPVPSQQQQQQQQQQQWQAPSTSDREPHSITLFLQPNELQAFFKALLELVSAATAIAAPLPEAQQQQQQQQPSGWSTAQPGPWLGAPRLQVRYNPSHTHTKSPSPATPHTSSPSSLSAGAPTSPPSPPSPIEISWSPSTQSPTRTWQTTCGASPSTQPNGLNQQEQWSEQHGHENPQCQQHVVLRLSEVHIRSLLGIYNDVSSRNPGLLELPSLPTKLDSTVDMPTSPGPLSTFSPVSNRWQWRAGLVLASSLAGAAAGALLGGGNRWSLAGSQTSVREQQVAVAESAMRQQDRKSSKQKGGLPRVQPANDCVDAETMAGLCEAVKQQVHGKMWMPVAKEIGRQQQATTLRYQVVLKRSGEVVGCMPCDKVSMVWYQRLPLSAAIRSPKFQKMQQRHLESARPDAPKPNPLQSLVAPAERARYVRMPPEGLVVLQLELQQQLEEAAVLSSSSKPSLGSKIKSKVARGQEGAQTEQAQVLWAPLHATVRSWSDADSVHSMLSYEAQISSIGRSGAQQVGSAQMQRTERQQQQQQPIQISTGAGQGFEATLQAIAQQLLEATKVADQAKQQSGGEAAQVDIVQGGVSSMPKQGSDYVRSKDQANGANGR